MPRIVSSTDASQCFFELLGLASAGETVIITERGHPVAQLTPFNPRSDRGSRAAWNRLLKTLEEGLPLGGKSWGRDSLYE